MYYDLNIPYTNDRDTSRTLSFLSSLGYSTVAVSTILNGSKLPSQLPSPPALPTHPSSLKVLTRCTLVLDNPSQNHRLAALSSLYSILALRPTSEKLLLQACTSLDCDLISLDFSQRLPFQLKFKTVGAALLRGLSFEICYSAAVTDLQARRNLIQNAASLVRATRGGRGIIVSSEARQALALRAPNDVSNLAVLWGLSPDKAKDAVSGRCRVLVRQAEMRRHSFKGVVEVVDDGVTEEEKLERKRKAAEQGGGAGKKGKQGGGGNGAQAGGGQKLSKKERRAQAAAAKAEKATAS
ncbi:RNase P subunit p30-domain-containing protein [Sphaerosporella brunnea]|uniref:RNase P subunit p30-domain-containing protein n=1 Tax=Sphaerosporella brunnea TaxID=1250544 RepID=A0A5J5F5A1_9PEZI|nr:RNase P subunit p30-domain-containing protein [Sphaerosporella brunnea]